MSTTNLGHVTAYAYAKSKGYTGTEEEFAEAMANFSGSAEIAVNAANAAAGYESAASTAAGNAMSYRDAAAGSATTASTAAGNALSYRDSAAASAQSADQAAEDARLYKGSPLVAATAAGMTNTERIYVYTGSEVGYTPGNWYYYDGDSWESGGVYNASAVQTDDTLSEEGMAADAKAAGAVAAPVFKATDDYAAGTYVLRSGKLYRFRENHAAGAWTGTDATEVKLAAEVSELKSSLSREAECAFVTPGYSQTSNGVTVEVTGDELKIYGTATASRYVAFLNGLGGIMTTSAAFKKTLDSGTYHVHTEIRGTATIYDFRGTYSTFASDFSVASYTDTDVDVTFTSDVMIGVRVISGRDYGTSANPTYVKFTAKKYVVYDADPELLRTSLAHASAVSINTDYDSILEPKTYYVSSGANALTMKNCPVITAHILIVYPYSTLSGRIAQTIIQPSDYPNIYTRIYYNGVFRAWQKVNAFPLIENTPYTRKLNAMLDRLKIVSYVQYSTLPYNTGEVGEAEYYNTGDRLNGILYSSVWRDGQDVFRNLTLETYYSALYNPTSVLYTESYTGKNIPNAHAYYGAVCSTFVGYISGIEQYKTTGQLISSLTRKDITSLYDLESGDLLVMANADGGHIIIISQVYTNENGAMIGVDLSEETTNGSKVFRTLFYDLSRLQRLIDENNYVIMTNPNPGKVSMLSEPDFNAEIIYERGNNTYIEASDISTGAWFYIPNASTIYYKKDDGAYSSVLLSGVSTKTVNGYTVYNLATCFDGIGNYEFTDDTSGPKTCVIKMIDTGAAVLAGNTLVLSGWRNCVPRNYYIVKETARTSPDQNSAMNPSAGYVCSYTNKAGEITVGDDDASVTVNIPADYTSGLSRYKVWIEYDTGVGYKQAFSNLVTV